MATIANYRNNLLHSSATRVGTTLGEGITSTIPAFIEPKGSTTLVPSTATITVDPGNYTNPTYTWYTVVNGSTVTLISGQTTKTYTLPAATFKTVVSTYSLVTYRVVLSQTGYPNKVLEYTIALVREGTDSAVFGINNAAAIFTKNTAGSITPSSIELTTTAVNMSSITSYQWLKDGVVISGATSASYSVPNTDFTSVKTHQYTCNVTGTVNGVAGTVLTDNITIPRLDEVGSAPTPTLTNENVSFPAPVSGYSGITFTNGASVVEMYLGATKLTYAASGANTFNCTNASTGATVASGTGSGSAFTVPAPTAMSADAAYTDVTINYRDSLGVANSVVRRITYALARTGVQGNIGNTGSAGANAALLNITTSGALFTKNTSGTITPSTITLATAAENVSSITGYQWYKDAVLISGATSSTYAVPSSDYTSATTHIYRCVVSGTVNGVAGSTREDSITIPRLDDSGTGPTAVLSNSNITFPAPVFGSYSGITFTNGACTVEMYLGATKLNYSASGANTFSCTTSSTSATVAAGSGMGSIFTVPAPTAMSSDAAYTDVTITYRNSLSVSNSLVCRITYSLARTGDQGLQGFTGNQGSAAALLNITTAGAVFTKNTAGSITPSTLTLATNTQNIAVVSGYQWYKDGASISGATSSTYAVPSSDFTATTTHVYKCVATGTINGVASSTREDSLTIPRLDEVGTGPTAVLSNENISFPAATSGFSGINFANGACTVETYLGATKLTYAASGANTFSCTKNTVGATVAAGSGAASVFTLPAPTAMSSDAAYTDVTITYRDAAGTSNVITKRINYSLTRAGAQGNTGGTGTRGNLELYSTDAAYNSTYTYLSFGAGAPSYAAKATALIAAAAAGSTPTTPIQNDTVTFSNGTSYVYTITYNSAAPAWETPGTVIDGSLLVTQSVTANKIDTRGLTIKDASGNIIMQAGSSIDWAKLGSAASNLSGLGYTGALNATYGAAIGSNLTGQFTVGNASTFFADAAINTAQIGELDAIKLTARSIKTDKIEIGAATANASYYWAGSVDINTANTTDTYYLASGESVLNGVVPGAKILILGSVGVNVVGYNTSINLLRYYAVIETNKSFDGGTTWQGWSEGVYPRIILYNEPYSNIYGGTRNFSHRTAVVESIENPLTGWNVITNLKFRIRRVYTFTSGAGSLTALNPNGNIAIGDYARDASNVYLAAYEFKV